MKKNLYFLLLIVVSTAFMYGCKKTELLNNNDNRKKDILKKVESLLTNKSYSNLDISNIRILKSNTGEEIIAKIPVLNNPNKVLYVGLIDSAQNFRWVQVYNKEKMNGKLSFNLVISDLQDNILNNYQIVNDKIEQFQSKYLATNGIRKKSLTDETEPVIEGSGGDVIVHSTYKTQYVSRDIDMWRIGFILGSMAYGNYLESIEPLGTDGDGNQLTEIIVEVPKVTDDLYRSIGKNTKWTKNANGSTSFTTEFQDFLVGVFASMHFSVDIDASKVCIPETVKMNVYGFSLNTYTVDKVYTGIYDKYDNVTSFTVKVIIGLPIVGGMFSTPEYWNFYIMTLPNGAYQLRVSKYPYGY
jgi:hypothetical protein